MPLRIEDFHYDLPEELIAKQPLADRAGARMLVLDRKAQTFRDDVFLNFPNYLAPGDCLTLNNTRVLPVRLLGHREGHTGEVEIFLLRANSSNRRLWRALVRPGKKLPPGEVVVLNERLKVRIVNRLEQGEREVELLGDVNIDEELERIGHVPLPPYINRPDEDDDKERYQTVFASEPGSAAAPTAGLHFTPQILEASRQKGADIAEVTLHVGLGTFLPLQPENLETLRLHQEYYEVPWTAAQKLNAAKRIVAVGTTTVRTLETARRFSPDFRLCTGETDLFIAPGFYFRAAGAMLTNFHLPSSSLIMLVAAFAGYDLTMTAYRHAVANRYRFFSYGDCMLIL